RVDGGNEGAGSRRGGRRIGDSHAGRCAQVADHPPDAPQSAHRTTSCAWTTWTNSSSRAIEIKPMSITQAAETRSTFRRATCDSNEPTARIIKGPVPAPKRAIVSSPCGTLAELLAGARKP